MDNHLDTVLDKALKKDVGRKLQVLGKIVYGESKNTFGLTPARARPRQGGPSRRQQEIASLRKELRSSREYGKQHLIHSRDGMAQLESVWS